MMDSVWKFIAFWYTRFLLVTELYIVEQWERVLIYIVFLIMFTLLSVFNNYVVLEMVSKFVTRRGVPDIEVYK